MTEDKKNAITMDESKLDSAPRYERTAVALSASPRTRPTDTDRDGKSDRTDKAPLDPNRK